MDLHIEILTVQDEAIVREYEKEKLETLFADEMDREMAAWNAPWRPESLAHHLATGWSVGVFESPKRSKLIGYFLAQPLLFFKGLTQVLWLEHISADSPAIREFLIETSGRYAREKHLQSVLWDGGEIKTTKR